MDITQDKMEDQFHPQSFSTRQFPVLKFVADCPMDRIALIRMLRWQQVGAGNDA
jgi:hypothetical protein